MKIRLFNNVLENDLGTYDNRKGTYIRGAKGQFAGSIGTDKPEEDPKQKRSGSSRSQSNGEQPVITLQPEQSKKITNLSNEDSDYRLKTLNKKLNQSSPESKPEDVADLSNDFNVRFDEDPENYDQLKQEIFDTHKNKFSDPNFRDSYTFYTDRIYINSQYKNNKDLIRDYTNQRDATLEKFSPEIGKLESISNGFDDSVFDKSLTDIHSTFIKGLTKRSITDQAIFNDPKVQKAFNTLSNILPDDFTVSNTNLTVKEFYSQAGNYIESLPQYLNLRLGYEGGFLAGTPLNSKGQRNIHPATRELFSETKSNILAGSLQSIDTPFKLYNLFKTDRDLFDFVITSLDFSPKRSPSFDPKLNIQYRESSIDFTLPNNLPDSLSQKLGRTKTISMDRLALLDLSPEELTLVLRNTLPYKNQKEFLSLANRNVKELDKFISDNQIESESGLSPENKQFVDSEIVRLKSRLENDTPVNYIVDKSANKFKNSIDSIVNEIGEFIPKRLKETKPIVFSARDNDSVDEDANVINVGIKNRDQIENSFLKSFEKVFPFLNLAPISNVLKGTYKNIKDSLSSLAQLDLAGSLTSFAYSIAYAGVKKVLGPYAYLYEDYFTGKIRGSDSIESLDSFIARGKEFAEDFVNTISIQNKEINKINYEELDYRREIETDLEAFYRTDERYATYKQYIQDTYENRKENYEALEIGAIDEDEFNLREKINENLVSNYRSYLNSLKNELFPIYARQDPKLIEFQRRRDELNEKVEGFRDRLLNNSSISQEEAEKLFDTIDIPNKHKDPEKFDKLKDTVVEFIRLTNGMPLAHLKKIDILEGIRENASRSGGIQLNENSEKWVVFHELGHHVEYSNRAIGKASKEFIRSRRESDIEYKLSELTRNKNYLEDEIAYKGRFINPYVGKITPGLSSEVVSVGLQHFVDLDNIRKFAQQDPEHFYYMVGVITNPALTNKTRTTKSMASSPRIVENESNFSYILRDGGNDPIINEPMYPTDKGTVSLHEEFADHDLLTDYIKLGQKKGKKIVEISKKTLEELDSLKKQESDFLKKNSWDIGLKTLDLFRSHPDYDRLKKRVKEEEDVLRRLNDLLSSGEISNTRYNELYLEHLKVSNKVNSEYYGLQQKVEEDYVNSLEEVKNLRQRQKEVLQPIEDFRKNLIKNSAVSLTEATKLVDKLSFPFTRPHPDSEPDPKTEKFNNEIRKLAIDFVRLNNLKDLGNLRYINMIQGRSFAVWDSVSINREYLDFNNFDEFQSVVFHELGHHVEFMQKDIKKASAAFILAGRKYKYYKRLSDITSDTSYENKEIAYEGYYYAPYIGKYYSDYSSEVVSMGMQMFYNSYEIAKFASKDPEHFYYMLGIISNAKNKRKIR